MVDSVGFTSEEFLYSYMGINTKPYLFLCCLILSHSDIYMMRSAIL